MKKIVMLLLATLPFAAQAKEITQAQYKQVFKNDNACFILYNVNQHKIVSEYNPHNRCNERISPNSTFKIPLSLMAFNQGIITQDTVFKWDGVERALPQWNQDQTPHTWLQYSTIWVSQEITPQLGQARIQHYLAGFNYGNQDFSGDPGMNNGLTYAWLSSSLKISAIEQLNFLNAMLNNQLPINNDAVINTEKNLYLGKLANGASYYGKTGSGRHGNNEREPNPSQLREGLFEGFIQQGNQQYIFVSNLSNKAAPPAGDKSYGSGILQPIVMTLLNQYFSG